MSARPTSDALHVVTRELEQALAGIEPQSIEALRALLAQGGRRWFASGQGRSGLVAAMIAMRLMHLGKDAHLVGEATAPAVGPGDGLLLLSRSGSTPTTVAHAQVAAAEGALTVAVTEEPSSPLAALADVVLALPGGASQQFGGSRFEQSVLILLDAVVLALAADDVDQRGMDQRHTNLQ